MQRKHANELCKNVTAATTLILARVFGNSPDFWPNCSDAATCGEVMNSLSERERIERAMRLRAAA